MKISSTAHTSVFLCLDFPYHASFGCDLHSWTFHPPEQSREKTTLQNRNRTLEPHPSRDAMNVIENHVAEQKRLTHHIGISDLPMGEDVGCASKTGLVFVHYSVGHGLSRGFFFQPKMGDFNVVQWNEANEEMDLQPVIDEATVGRLMSSAVRSHHHSQPGEAVSEINVDFGKYNPDKLSLWKALTCFINEDVLRRCGLALEMVITPGDIRTVTAAVKSHSLEPEKHLVPYFKDTHRAPCFPSVPQLVPMIKRYRTWKRVTKTGASAPPDQNAWEETGGREKEYFELFKDPSQITALNFDPSPLLVKFLNIEFPSTMGDENSAPLVNQAEVDTFFGVFQLSFLLFLYLGSLEGMEYWKQIIHLITASSTFLTSIGTSVASGERKGETTSFVERFLILWKDQLSFAPADFFEGDLLSDNFLQASFVNLFSSHSTTDAGSSLNSFKAFLNQTFGRQFLTDIMSRVNARSKETDQVVGISTEKHTMDVEDQHPMSSFANKEEYLAELNINNATTVYEAEKPLRMSWMLPPVADKSK